MTCRQQIDPRQRLYKLLQVGKRELGMEEDAYRALLARFGASDVDGRPSASTLGVPALEQVLEAMKTAGFRVRRQAPQVDWRKPRIDLAYAIWCALADGGAVRDRSFLAFERWTHRLTGVAKVEWAGSDGLNACVEALKKWARRECVELPQHS